jgi:hypothetical protein
MISFNKSNLFILVPHSPGSRHCLRIFGFPNSSLTLPEVVHEVDNRFALDGELITQWGV